MSRATVGDGRSCRSNPWGWLLLLLLTTHPTTSRATDLSSHSRATPRISIFPASSGTFVAPHELRMNVQAFDKVQRELYPGWSAGSQDLEDGRSADWQTVEIESSLYEAILERIGLPYRLGGTDDLGYDCSGFIWRVFQLAGIDFRRASVRDMWEQFPEVEEGEEGAFGVIVFFSGLTHAGIVRDVHSFYHASSSQGIVRSFYSDYWGPRITGYRRVPLPRPTRTRPRWSRPRVSPNLR